MNYLEIAAQGKLHIRQETIDFNRGQAITFLYASDLHLTRWTGYIIDQLVNAAQAIKPHFVLLGGDLVDLSNGLPHLARGIEQLSQVYPIWAVPGNHDKQVSVQTVQQCVEVAGGHWLEGTTYLFGNDSQPSLSIDGRCQCRLKSTEFSILCTHDPAIFPKAARCGYDLVLAGHLHGGQFVYREVAGRLYPGALVYPWNGDSFKLAQTTMFVSRGMNDTLPIRWNCPRDVIVCHLV